MVGSQALSLAVENLALHRARALVVALRDEKIFQYINRPQADGMITAETLPGIAYHSFEQRARVVGVPAFEYVIAR